MLCTKSPNKFKYADNFDGCLPVFSGSCSSGAVAAPVLDAPRERSSPSALFFATPEALPSVCASLEWLWEWPACAWPSSLPRTRRVFSMRKNDAKPTNMPSLYPPELSTTDLGGAIERGGRGKGRESTIPDEDVALLLDHDEVHAAALVLAHERVRHEVEKHVREEAAGLPRAAISFAGGTLARTDEDREKRSAPRRPSWC